MSIVCLFSVVVKMALSSDSKSFSWRLRLSISILLPTFAAYDGLILEWAVCGFDDVFDR